MDAQTEIKLDLAKIRIKINELNNSKPIKPTSPPISKFFTNKPILG